MDYSGLCFHIVCAIFLVILLLKLLLQHSATVLSRVPKGGKVAMCLMEKMHVLNKFHSGINYSAFSCEFSVYESTIYIKYHVFKQKHT